LQTEEYAQAIVKAITPKIDPDIHRQRVEVWMRRQELLQPDERPRYRVLLDEAVLHRRVGGPQLMAAQLEKMLVAERHSRVTIQVVPFDLATHAVQDSNVVLLEFGEASNLSPIIFIEGLTSNQYFERLVDITSYREALEYLRDSALSPRDSVQQVEKLREAYISETEGL
jgi:Domain of unknown function (DUF5753)